MDPVGGRTRGRPCHGVGGLEGATGRAGDAAGARARVAQRGRSGGVSSARRQGRGAARGRFHAPDTACGRQSDPAEAPRADCRGTRSAVGDRSCDRRRWPRTATHRGTGPPARPRRPGSAARPRAAGGLPEIYGAADLLVHPSLREGWPNVLLESMACGTPVLATNFDSVGEIVGAAEAGRVSWRRRRQPAWPRAIKELLAVPPKREATRRYAEGFDWQVTTSGQIELFRDICTSWRQRPRRLASRISAAPGEPWTAMLRFAMRS